VSTMTHHSPSTHRPQAHAQLGPFPAPAWTRLREVVLLAADGRPGPVEVVVGPTGVHVVSRQVPGAGDVCLLRTRDALLAADAVAAALPPRYRPVVDAMLLLDGDDTAGGLVAGVAVASAQVLSEAIRFKPLVLSRSEARVVSSLLRAALYPEPAAGRSSRWGRLTCRGQQSLRAVLTFCNARQMTRARGLHQL